MTATAAVTLGVLGRPASGASESKSVTRRTVDSMAKVMVVDDAKSELKLIEGILKTAGHEVVCFPDGEELEERVVLERPDLLLLDIVMPHRNGYEILRSLKRDERTRAMPVVLVSSKNQESDRVWGKRQGADEYLGKPFTAEQLVTVVRQFVR
jgi:Response regulators consisting of a CheY-like receiver domain and a winged-helix DNA-binding domain